MKWNFTSLGLTNTYFSARININVAFPTTYMQPFPLVPDISLLCKNNNYVKKQQKNSCRDKDKKNLNTKVVGKRWRLLKSNGELWTNINNKKQEKKQETNGVATYLIMWSFWIFLLSWHKWKWLVKCDVVPTTTKQHFTKFYPTSTKTKTLKFLMDLIRQVLFKFLRS